jgi:hypothetical protein
LGRKLFNDAHASINVPSTLKCSLEIQTWRRPSSTTSAKNQSATAWESRRSWFGRLLGCKFATMVANLQPALNIKRKGDKSLRRVHAQLTPKA